MGSFGHAAYFLVGVIVSGILYGIFFVLFCATLYVFYRKSAVRQSNVVLLSASVAIFVLTTAYVILSSSRAVDGLILNPTTTDLDLYFLDISSWTALLESTILAANTLVADAILIYRCWIVWNYRWPIVAFNVLLWLFTFVCLNVVAILTARAESQDLASILKANLWNTIFIAVSLTQNLIATGLLAFRLWRVDAGAAAYKQGSLMPIMRIVIESGSLYAATLLTFLVLSVIEAPPEFIMQSALNSMIGVTFSLIIVRIGLSVAKTPSESSAPTHLPELLPMRQINIMVDHHTDFDGSSLGDDDEGGHEQVGRSRGSRCSQKNLRDLRV